MSESQEKTGALNALTKEQIERAAIALARSIHGPSANPEDLEYYREHVAAALVAAGVASPASSEPEPGPLTLKFDSGRGAMLDSQNRIVGYYPEALTAASPDREGFLKRVRRFARKTRGNGFHDHADMMDEMINALASPAASDEALLAAERAEAVRETARYVKRIAPKVLIDCADVLADMEIAAERLSRGIHANGRDRGGN